MWVSFISISLCLFSSLQANENSTLNAIKGDLQAQLNDLTKWDLRNDINYNVNHGACFYDQKAGLNLIGPSGYIRTRVSDIQPIHVSLPHLDVGCGGIDYALGGINIASGKSMYDALKHIGINAATHALLLGMITFSPEIKDAVATVQHWANQANSMDFNSCEIGSSLVENLWPASENTKQFICSNLGAKHYQFRDRISARHGCSSNSGALEKQLAQKGLEEAKSQDLLTEEFNLAWEVIKHLTKDTKEQDLYLNISGTIIKKKSTDKKKDFDYIFYPSRVDHVIDVLVDGGVIKEGYRFKRTNGQVDPFTIEENKEVFVGTAINQEGKKYWAPSGIKQKILKILEKQKKAVLEERRSSVADLTQGEEDILKLSKFPIEKLIILMARKEGKLFEHYLGLDEIAQVMAMSIAIHQIDKMLKILIFGAEFFQSKQVMNLRDFLSSLKEKLIIINQRKLDLNHTIQEKYRMIEFLINLENNLNEKGDL